MSFKENVDLYVDQSAKNLNFRKDLLEHIKSTHSLIKVNVGVELDKTIHGDHRMESGSLRTYSSN